MIQIIKRRILPDQGLLCGVKGKRGRMESSSGIMKQSLFVMRHGERLDNCDLHWVEKAPRPWDPPLTDKGKLQAWEKGKMLKKEGANITRVFCSPFLRCVQTAAEVVLAFCATDDIANAPSSKGVNFDPSKVKVSIELGLCEVMNSIAIRSLRIPPSPSNMITVLDHSELEVILPAGTVDHYVEPIWTELPKWEEKTKDAHKRYSNTFQELADKFPQENVLCVTHGEGVGVSVSALKEDTRVYEVEYCAYSHSQRTIFSCSTDGLEAGNFDVLTESGASGIKYLKDSRSCNSVS